MTRDERQAHQKRESQTQRMQLIRRRGRRFFEERLSTTIWWRKPRISAWRARRDRKLKRRVEISEESTAAMG